MVSCAGSWLIIVSMCPILGPLFIFAAFGALCCVGFTSAGVVGGSLAAVLQSDFPLVPAKSCFAGLQSMAALGPFALNPAVYAFASVIVLVCGVTIQYYYGCHLSECSCHVRYSWEQEPESSMSY
jgi:hypothetical protein